MSSSVSGGGRSSGCDAGWMMPFVEEEVVELEAVRFGVEVDVDARAVVRPRRPLLEESTTIFGT